MARSLSSIRLVTKAIVDAAPWRLDPQVHPMPWREEAYQEAQSRPLVIGLLIDDGIVKVHPPVERIVNEVAAKLQEAGHEVIAWDSSGHADCIQIMVSVYMAATTPSAFYFSEAGVSWYRADTPLCRIDTTPPTAAKTCVGTWP